MSILIRGMKMPKNCLGCPLTWVDDDYDSVCPFTNVVALNIGRQDDCPLIELPPHGNLKDESDIISLIEVMFCKDKDGMEHAIQCVKDAPTVIEAERET